MNKLILAVLPVVAIIIIVILYLTIRRNKGNSNKTKDTSNEQEKKLKHISIVNFENYFLKANYSNLSKEDMETYISLLEKVLSYIVNSDEAIRGILYDTHLKELLLIQEEYDEEEKRIEKLNITNQVDSDKMINVKPSPRKNILVNSDVDIPKFRYILFKFVDFLNKKQDAIEYNEIFNESLVCFVMVQGSKWFEGLGTVSLIKDLELANIIPKGYRTLDPSLLVIKKDYIDSIINGIYCLSHKVMIKKNIE